MAEEGGEMNSIRIIHPYTDNGSLVFDDPTVGLVREPFVSGADLILIALAVKVGANPDNGFTLLFSDIPFPGHQAKAEWTGSEVGGDWYSVGEYNGWLCPALLKYFDKAPKNIYFQIREKNDQTDG